MKRAVVSIALVAVVALGGVLAYAVWKGKFARPQDYFESGKKYYEQEKYPEAVIQFLNAIQRDGRHRDAWYFLALTYEEQHDLERAAVALRGLLEAYPEDVTANVELGRLYLEVGQVNSEFFRHAQELADKVLAKDPQNVKALVLSAHVAAGQKNYTTAAELYEKAIQIDPKAQEALLGLGVMKAVQKKYGEAEETLLKARDADPTNKSALRLLSSFYRAVGENSKAEAVIKDALTLNPTDTKTISQALGFYDKTGRFDEVEMILREEQAKKPDNPGPSLLLVDFYDSKNRPADAEKLLNETKQRFPKSIDVAEKIAVRYLEAKPDRARPEIDLIMKSEPNNPIGHVLLGELQFQTGQYDAAEATFGKKPALDSPFPQPHYFLGRIAFNKGQTDSAIDHYQKALAINRNFLPGRVELADALLSKGRLADSREEVRKVLSVDPTYGQAWLVKIALDRIENKTSDLEQELSALMKDQPQNPLVFREAALYSDSRGRTADAEKNYLRVLELQPESQQALSELIGFYIRQKMTDRAIQRLNAIPDDKKQAFHYELLGLTYSQARQLPAAENAYKTALRKDPSRTSSDLYLFTDYLRAGRTDDALQALNDALKQNPKDTGTLTVKGTFYESQGKIDEAAKIYSEVLKMDPNSDVAANNLACILAEQGRDLQSALQYAQMVRKKQPDSPTAADTLGWVYLKLGNYIMAREQGRFAVSKDPNNGTFLYHLALSYKGANQTSEALATLKKAVRIPRDFKEKSLAQAALKDLAK